MAALAEVERLWVDPVAASHGAKPIEMGRLLSLRVHELAIIPVAMPLVVVWSLRAVILTVD